MRFLPAAVFLAGLLVAGCSASSTVGSPGTVLSSCLSVEPPVLLYPAPGATGIRQSRLQLYFGYPQNPGVSFAPPELTPSSGLAIVAGPYASPSPGPFPPGMATVPNGDQVFVSNVPGYESGTTYTVSVKSDTCGQGFPLGSFGT